MRAAATGAGEEGSESAADESAAGTGQASEEVLTDDSRDGSDQGLTRTHAIGTFSWTIGGISGAATGVTRVFISNEHLGQDSMTWQALSYSATFSPSALAGTRIRGIQAGLADPSASVFSSTELPGVVERARFERGFFELFFQTRCEPFGPDTLVGSLDFVDPAKPQPSVLRE